MKSPVTVGLFLTITSSVAIPAMAQAPLPTSPQSAPAAYSRAELERIVSPIALYPDPLLAQVLAAALTHRARSPAVQS
jgi:hypothetical protein